MKNSQMQKLLSKKNPLSRSPRSTVAATDAAEEATSSSFNYSKSNGGRAHLSSPEMRLDNYLANPAREDEKNCSPDDDDMSYYSAMSTDMDMSMEMSPFTHEAISYETTSCDFPADIFILDPPRALETRHMGNQDTQAYTSEMKVISPLAPPSTAMLLYNLPSQMSQELKESTSVISYPPPPLSVSTYDTIETGEQDDFYNSMNSTYTQASSDDDYTETTEIAETMETFHEVAINKVSKFIAKNKRSIREVPSKLLKRKLHLKIMSVVCILFLASQSLSGADGINNDESILPPISEADDTLKKFSIMDLRNILLWFLLLINGQKLLSRTEPQRRERRTWKSRRTPVNLN